MKAYKGLSGLKRNLLLIPVFLSLGCANLGPMLSEPNETYHKAPESVPLSANANHGEFRW